MRGCGAAQAAPLIRCRLASAMRSARSRFFAGFVRAQEQQQLAVRPRRSPAASKRRKLAGSPGSLCAAAARAAWPGKITTGSTAAASSAASSIRTKFCRVSVEASETEHSRNSRLRRLLLPLHRRPALQALRPLPGIRALRPAWSSSAAETGWQPRPHPQRRTRSRVRSVRSAARDPDRRGHDGSVRFEGCGCGRQGKRCRQPGQIGAGMSSAMGECGQEFVGRCDCLGSNSVVIPSNTACATGAAERGFGKRGLAARWRKRFSQCGGFGHQLGGSGRSRRRCIDWASCSARVEQSGRFGRIDG